MNTRTAVGALAIVAVLGMALPLSAASLHPQRAATDVAAPDVALHAVQLTPPPAVREVLSRTFVAGVSALQSDSAICYRPAGASGDCYIRWQQIGVSAPASAYVVSMTVEIDSRLRAYHAGFFQSTMYIPGDMIDPGYRVKCGAPGSGGLPEFGRVYSYTVRARFTDASENTNTGSSICPADRVPAYLPLVRR
jgi:hypothetical protein